DGRVEHGTDGGSNPQIKVVNDSLGITLSYLHVDLTDPITVPHGTNIIAGEPIARISDKGVARFKHIHFTVHATTSLNHGSNWYTWLSYASNYASLPNKWEFAEPNVSPPSPPENVADFVLSGDFNGDG